MQEVRKLIVQASKNNVRVEIPLVYRAVLDIKKGDIMLMTCDRETQTITMRKEESNDE